MATTSLRRRVKEEKGATIILVAVSMVVLLGMAALAIDVGYLYVVRGELQNAADSGALAGAQVLYLPDGTQVDTSETGAIPTATAYVANNYSEQAAVQVQSVDRGHWNPATREFTANNITIAPPRLWDQTTVELNNDPNFINAVRVITTRKTLAATGKPEQPFFARILGAGPIDVTASAVAYIGFAGTLKPTEADEPIAICKQALLDSNGKYTCNIGRMLTNNSDTAAWTNFSQPCATASGSDMAPLICATGNQNPIALGSGMGTTNGVQDTTLQSLETCWKSQAGIDTTGPLGVPDGVPDQLWSLTLPVIDCPNSIGPCTPVVGAVEVTVVWINRNTDPQMNDIPQTMFNPATGTQWTCNPAVTGKQACWNDFAETFHLVSDALGTPAPYQSKTLYYLPKCAVHIPEGITGGENFGIMAKTPVLVK